MTKNVVLVTHSEDISGMLPEIRKHLEARGAAVMRFDTDRFPLEGQVRFGQEPAGDTMFSILQYTCGGM